MKVVYIISKVKMQTEAAYAMKQNLIFITVNILAICNENARIKYY